MLENILRRLGTPYYRLDSYFEKRCIDVTIRAFYKMKGEGVIQPNWNEIIISAVLIRYMREIKNNENIPIKVDPENHLYNNAILSGQINPNTAPRIDIKVSGAWSNEDIYYGIETKILVQNNYQTRNAHYLCNQYIIEGIDRFIDGRYSPKVSMGCMLGYVLQGNPNIIRNNINEILNNTDRNCDCLNNYAPLNHEYCFRSQHHRIQTNDSITLCHIFLLVN